jgi:predicted AlkP superfamily pyrophosphatase or phosphodiesterase
MHSSLRAAVSAVAVLALVALSSLRPVGASAAGPVQDQEAPPRIVVLVVVDQLRADLLDRYDAVFTQGLRRLRDEGYRFDRATHDHSITLTAPGHATIVTGTEPRKHGVVSNLWFEIRGQQWLTVENVLDPEVSLVADTSLMGASPSVLQRSGIADWLQDAHPEAKVISVSGKARAAVLMASHSRAQAYWFEGAVGRFVSSRHYLETYPEWVAPFHDEVLAPMSEEVVWEMSVPEGFRGLARADSADYEGDGTHTTFPHAYTDSEWLFSQGQFWSWWATTPPLDRATRLLAQTAAEAEELGRDDVPDLLAISFSQTDRVGHAYGPLSLEQLDNLYRLDQELGAFLDWLDAEYGPDGYVLALTADHGVADSPEHTAAQGRWAMRVPRDSSFALQTIMNDAAGRVGRADRQALAEALRDGVTAVSWIEQAWTYQELGTLQAAADSFTVLQVQSSHPGRYTGLLGRQGLEMRFAENSLLWAYPRGSTHGSPYMYDRHVPFILFGRGVEAGSSSESVSVSDFAPTLAAILGIGFPDDLDGVPRRAGQGG